MQDITATLADREKTYGNFLAKAQVIQQLKGTMKESPGWSGLPDDMKESLEMIAVKIGRILYGNPDHHDSWHDIGGYAKLVADRISQKS